MAKSKIKINPVTMEIEIEVSDSFLEKFFEKMNDRFPKSKKLTPKIKSIKTKIEPVPKVKTGKTKIQKPPVVKGKSGFIQSGIFEIIKKGKDDGVSVSDIVKSTKLEKSQVYNTVKILKSKGFIKQAGRGKYIIENGEEWSYLQDMEE